MNIYEAFETEDSRWVEVEFQGKVICSVRIRSANPDLNPQLRAAMKDEAMGLVKEKGTEEAEALTVHMALADSDLELRLFAIAVITDWKGVTSKKGGRLPCNPKNVEKVMRDLPLVFKQIRTQAYRWETFRAAATDAAVGNSKTS